MKIALIRIHSRYHDDYNEEWFKDYMTEFAEVTQDEFEALRQFVYTFNDKNLNGQRYVLVEDEIEKLPKTIAEAIEFAAKKKKEWQDQMEKMQKEKVAKDKEHARKRKLKENEKLRKTVAELEKYKKRLEKLEGKKEK